MSSCGGIVVSSIVPGGHTQRPPKQNHCSEGSRQSVCPSVTRPCPTMVTFTSGDAGLRTTQEGTVVRLWVKNLPGGPEDVYEVFCDAKGWSASAGTFRVDARGNGYVILTSAVKRGQYESLRIVRRAHFPSGQVEDYDILEAKLS